MNTLDKQMHAATEADVATPLTVTALFDRYEDASEAVRRIEALGVPHSNISIVSNDESHRDRVASATDETDRDNDNSGTGVGASAGTLVGGGVGLLAGLGVLAIPGVGPVVAAGWLISTLVGAGVGAAAGGVVGALTGEGMDEHHAHAYEEGIRRGGTLVTVRALPGTEDQVEDILDDHGHIDIGARQEDWRREGWSGPNTTGISSAEAVRPMQGAGFSGSTGPSTGMGSSTGELVDERPAATPGGMAR